MSITRNASVGLQIPAKTGGESKICTDLVWVFLNESPILVNYFLPHKLEVVQRKQQDK
jgi:hypothetical protein